MKVESIVGLPWQLAEPLLQAASIPFRVEVLQNYNKFFSVSSKGYYVGRVVQETCQESRSQQAAHSITVDKTARKANTISVDENGQASRSQQAAHGMSADKTRAEDKPISVIHSMSADKTAIEANTISVDENTTADTGVFSANRDSQEALGEYVISLYRPMVYSDFEEYNEVVYAKEIMEK